MNLNRGRPLPFQTRQAIKALRTGDSPLSLRRIAAELGVSKTTAQRYAQRPRNN